MEKPTVNSSKRKKGRAVGQTIEAIEDRLISDAYDLVAKRIKDGSATSQETTHFLKVGSRRHRLELEKIRNENLLLQAKTKAIDAQRSIETLFKEAMEVMGIYQGGLAKKNEDD